MTDNYLGTETTKTFASDEIGGVNYAIVKAAFGALDTVTLVSSANPLPVTDAVTGAVADVAVTTDANGTVSAKLRGLIVLLAAMSAKLPATLGQKAMTASQAVVIASDQSAVPVSGTVTANPTTRTLTWVTGTCASSGDNSIIAASGGATKRVIKHLIVQNESGTATTIILRDGTTSTLRCYTNAKSEGIAISFPDGSEWRGTNNTAVQLNLSGANTVGYSIGYWTE